MKFLDHFAPCTPSFESQPAVAGVKMTAQQMWRFAAPAGIHECLAQKPGITFSSSDVFDAVPEINQIYKTPKTLGDRLGQGVVGNGLGLHAVRRGQHIRCRENATLLVLGACCLDFPEQRQRMADGESPEEVLATAELDVEAVAELVSATDFDSIEDMAEEIQAMPSLSDLGLDPQEEDAPDEALADDQS